MARRRETNHRRSVAEWLEDEMDDPPRRARKRARDDEDDKFETIASAIAMLEEKLDGASAGPRNPRRRNSANADPDLSEVIAQITSQQDALDDQYNGHNIDNIQRLQGQVRDLRSVLEAATQGSNFPGLTHDIRSLQQQMLPQIADTHSGMGAPMQQNFNSSLGQQLQALAQRAGLPQGTQTYLPALPATGTNVTGIEGLRRDVQTLRNSIRHSNETRTLQGLEGEIRALNRKLNEGGVSNAARDIQDIKARMDQLNRSIQESCVNGKNGYLAAQFQNINENIARVQRPVLPEQLVEDIRRELAETTRKLVPLSIHDARTLEKNIQFLAERLDSLRARQPDNARLQALEEQLGKLTAQLGHTDVFAGVERIEKGLQELTARLNTNESEASNGKAMNVLRGFQKQIEDVKATADASEKRMHQTLHALQDVIVKVAEKGSAQKSAPATSVDSSFGQRGGSAIAAAREAAAKAAQADDMDEAQAALDLGDMPASRRLENSFHAANKALYSDFRTRSERGFDHENYGSNVTPFRRARRYAAQTMLAAAGVVLVIGAYNLLGPVLNGEQTATAMVSETVDASSENTGLSFTAPKAESAAEEQKQLAEIEPTIAPRKLDIDLPAVPAGLSSRLRAAAQNGDVRAFYEIGSRLIDGSRGVSRDIKLGLDWLQLAADKQHAPAIFRIAQVYEKGQGVPRNLKLAAKNYQAAGELGNRTALYNLGVLYASGGEQEIDLEKARVYFTRSAELGFVNSQFNLGIIYATGMGVKQNLQEAYKWLAIAAQNGDTESAKRRDEIGSRFDGKTLVKAKLAAQSFKAEAIDPAANEDIIPASSWDDKAVPATADLSNIAPPGGKGGNGLSVDVSQAAQQ